jgi:membrane protein YdbS with pleckstrin-like domain
VTQVTALLPNETKSRRDGRTNRRTLDNIAPENPLTPEQHIWTGSPSQIKNLPAYLLAALLTLGILFATLVYRLWPPGIGFVGIPLLYALARWLRVGSQQFELTSERLLTSRGLLTRTTHSLELYRVKDMRIIQPFLIRLFGLENIELLTSDELNPKVVIDHIPSHLKLADQIRAHVESCRVTKGTREVEIE